MIKKSEEHAKMLDEKSIEVIDELEQKNARLEGKIELLELFIERLCLGAL